MERLKFIELLVSRHICILKDYLLESYLVNGITRGMKIPERGVIRVPAAFCRALAQLTEEIDYGCDFNTDGICWRNRSDFHSRLMCSDPILKQCCCTGCANSVGYLDQITFDSLYEHAALFDEKTGFWREGFGCTLPRQYRSATCLRHHCSSRLKRYHQTILALLGDVAVSYLDYRDWHASTSTAGPTRHIYSTESLTKYVNAWVARCPDGLYFSHCDESNAKTWGNYYAKNSDVPKSNTQARS